MKSEMVYKQAGQHLNNHLCLLKLSADLGTNPTMKVRKWYISKLGSIERIIFIYYLSYQLILKSHSCNLVPSEHLATHVTQTKVDIDLQQDY